MDKSAFLWFEPNVLGLALHQWSHKYIGNSERFAYAMEKKKKKHSKKLCSVRVCSCRWVENGMLVEEIR